MLLYCKFQNTKSIIVELHSDFNVTGNAHEH